MGEERSLTSDNLPLSQSTSDLLEKISVNCNGGAPNLVAEYIRQSLADNTKRAYLSDIRQFEAMAGPLPATDVVVATYIATEAARMNTSTLVRRLAALSKVHQLNGWPNPVRSPLVRSTLQGIRRVHYSQPQQAKALVIEDLAVTVGAMGDGLRDRRDRALLLVGFARALRRSEVVGPDVQDLAFVPQGVLLSLRRSKTDQVGAGRRIAIPFGLRGTCPATALKEWLRHSGIRDTAVF